ncbi:MAG: ftsW [Clostridia bacterium]|jgi:cell division protein FtsW|nr:ftsW [Clostridia bacterium]
MPAKKSNNMDFTLLITVLILLAIGVAMVFSASSISSQVKLDDKYFFLKSQGAYAILSIVVMLFLSKFDYKILGRFVTILLVISIVLLLLVFVPGIGLRLNGALRWISIGPMTMQPSEVAKFALILFMAKSISNKKDKIRTFTQGVLPYILLMGVFCFLIILEPNKSMAMIFVLLTFTILFSAGAKVWHLLIWGVPLLPAGAYILMKDHYSLLRLTAYLDPWADAQKSGYQAIQSLLALGSGGIFGLGLGNSRQKFFYIPEPQNDFIFAIIGEELGFIGTFTIIVLFMLLIWRGIRIALHAPDTFGCLLATGIVAMVGIQVVLNIAVATVSIPTTGVSLPFISQGGTSLLFVMANMGILLNISKHIKTIGS